MEYLFTGKGDRVLRPLMAEVGRAGSDLKAAQRAVRDAQAARAKASGGPDVLLGTASAEWHQEQEAVRNQDDAICAYREAVEALLGAVDTEGPTSSFIS